MQLIKSRRAGHRLVRWLVFAAAVVSVLWIWYSWDHSIYAPGFKESNFKKIRPGMTEGEVKRLLGPPLAETKMSTNLEAWYYNEKEIQGDGAFSIFGEPNAVFFTDKGTALRATGDLVERLHTGARREDVLRLLGPADRVVPAAERRLDYSKPRSFGRYRARIICLNRDSKVSEVVAYDTYD